MMIRLLSGMVISILLVLVTLAGCSTITNLLPATSFEDAPLIHHASVEPIKVLPGDTMTVTAEVSDPSGIESVTADMGGIETISLSLTRGSIYDGTWQGQWLVHDTTSRDYVTTIVATNSQGDSSTKDVLWSDPQTYERYHKEFTTPAVTSTETVTWTDALILTFTPNVTGNFLILGRADLANSDISYYTEAQVVYDSTVIDATIFTPNDADDIGAFGAHQVISLNSSTSYTFKLQIRTENALGTASVQNAIINAIAVSNYEYNEGTDTTNSTSTYADNAQLSFTPAAEDYLVIASMELALSVNNKSFSAQLYYDDGATPASWGELVKNPTEADEYMFYSIIRKYTLINAPTTLTIQFKTSGGVASIRSARITAVKLSDLGSARYTEVEAESSTGSVYPTWATFISLNFTPTTYENSLRIIWGLLSGDTAQSPYHGAVFWNTILLGESATLPNAITDYIPMYSAWHRNFGPVSNTVEGKYAAETPKNAFAKNARILVIRLDTLTPFSDSGHATYNNNFDTAGEDTVYIQGCYFKASTSYHVAYYDNDGAQVSSDAVSSDANGVVDSSYYFPGNKTAAPGTWHAVIYEDTQTPNTTYLADDPDSTREVAFTVTAAAIPEFPTTLAGIGVTGLCFGIYWWMRRRVCRVC